MSRLPFGMPFGWYPVAWADDLAPEAVERLHYFGRELVLFRTAGGAPAILDGHCPHLGAHLGVGGTVVDETIQCPFHAWRFGTDGTCAGIPYAERIPPKARTRAYPCEESAGMIWAWYHPRDAAPSFAPPLVHEFGAEGWTPTWTRYEWTVKTHPQEVVENSVDWPHFQHVHLMEMPQHREVDFVDHEVVWEASTSKNLSTMGDKVDDIHVEGRNPGLGASYVRYTGMLDTTILMGMTPIDTGTTHLRFGVIGKPRAEDPDEAAAFHQAYADELAKAVTQDFPIWENKTYHATPMLCDGDGPVPAFRRWAAQFYVDAEG